MGNDEISCKLLSDIIHNARIGQDAVHFLLEKTNNPQLQDELRKQERQYISIAGRAEKKLRTLGVEPEPSSPLSPTGLWTGTHLSTLIDAREALESERLSSHQNLT